MLSMVGLMPQLFSAVKSKVKKFYRKSFERNGRSDLSSNFGEMFFVSVSLGIVGALNCLVYVPRPSDFQLTNSSTNVGNFRRTMAGRSGGILEEYKSRIEKASARLWRQAKISAGECAQPLLVRYEREEIQISKKW